MVDSSEDGYFFFSLSLSLSYMTPNKISNRNDEFLIDVEFLIEIKRHNCALKHILEKKTIRLYLAVSIPRKPC